MVEITNIREYNGQQVILTSDRLVFVSKNGEHILLNSSGVVHTTAQHGVYIDVGNKDEEDTEKQFLVNAPKMQLGIDRNGTPEPITKADELELILKDMMQATADYADMVAALASIPPLLVVPTKFLKGKFQGINRRLKNFKSEKSFTI
jgi:hypothetical protein